MVLRLRGMEQSRLRRIGREGGYVRSCIRDVRFRPDNYLAESGKALQILVVEILPSQHLVAAGNGEEEQHAERAQLLWRTGEEACPPPISRLVEQDMIEEL